MASLSGRHGEKAQRGAIGPARDTSEEKEVMVATQPSRPTPTKKSIYEQPVALSNNAQVVLERRYLLKDETGAAVETPEGLFHRVASTLAAVERRYGADKRRVAQVEEQFYRL